MTNIWRQSGVNVAIQSSSFTESYLQCSYCQNGGMEWVDDGSKLRDTKHPKIRNARREQ